MLNVFVKKSAEELHVRLSDGRMMPLEDLVRDYERLLKEETSKKEVTSETKKDKEVAKELKVKHFGRDLKSQIKSLMRIPTNILA